MAPMGAVSIEQIAQRAGVDEEYIGRLEELGALHRDGAGYQERDVHVVALLHAWENAGLSMTSILAAVNAGQLSLDFLDGARVGAAGAASDHVPRVRRGTRDPAPSFPTTEETVVQVEGIDVEWEHVGPADLKGSRSR